MMNWMSFLFSDRWDFYKSTLVNHIREHGHHELKTNIWILGIGLHINAIVSFRKGSSWPEVLGSQIRRT